MDVAARLRALKSGFSRTFWVANTLELFERFAFYGSKAVLSIYLAEKVGLGTEIGNSLVGLYGGTIFLLPILAGPIVDRYGFKKSLIACFSIFCVGYFLIGLAGMPMGQGIVASVGKIPYITAVLLLTAVGGSLIKPCIVGTVARTTNADTKSLGYSIYYAMVNFGGAFGPVLASPIRTGMGIEYVLVMASLTAFLLTLGTLVFFTEPEGAPEGEIRTLGKVLKDAGLVFANFRFILFLVIFSGFWLMFWQVFLSLPYYVRDVLHFNRFEIIESVDAFTIIFLAVPLTALAKKLRPILAMSIGFAIASGSWLILAKTASIRWTIFGIGVYAVGEALQAPRFYEYVADLAPKDQVGTFMGFAFLPVALGYFAAGPLSGYLVQHYLKEGRDPSGMWVTLSVIGFISTALMLLYDRFVAPRKAS